MAGSVSFIFDTLRRVRTAGRSTSDKSVCVLTSHLIRLIRPISLMKILRSNASYCVATLRVSLPLENHTTCASVFRRRP